MVVCHCEAVNDVAIRAVLDDTATSVDDIVDRCGAGSACGGCHDTIRAIVDRYRRDRLASAVTTPRERVVAIASASR